MFARTVAALCGALVDDDARGRVAAAFVLRQHRRAPDWLRPGVVVGTWVLTLLCCLRTGRPLHRLDLPARRARVARWRRSRLDPVRNLLRFYDALAVFAVATASEDADG